MRLPAWLAPNRIAVYIGALVTILTGVAALLSAIGTPEAVALAAAVLGFVALLDRFLKGWQKWEAEVIAPVERAKLEAEHAPRDRADRPLERAPTVPSAPVPDVAPAAGLAGGFVEVQTLGGGTVRVPEDVPDDDALGFADVDELTDVDGLGGWAAADLDESAEAAAQPHLGDAGMPTEAEPRVEGAP